MTQTSEQHKELRKLAWEMRQSGMTLAAIGQRINRSSEEVRRLSFKHERLEKEQAERRAALQGLTVPELMDRPILDLELTARARNSFEIEKRFGEVEYTIGTVMAMSDEELLAFQNFGKVTAAATRAAIAEAIANAEKAERNDD